MGFQGVCTALYDHSPQGDQELSIQEGDLLYILDKSSDDGWWSAKKKAVGEDEDEPEGLIPNNYVQEAPPSHRAKALFDYTRQTDEELSFNEDASLSVYDTSDPDWTLVGLGDEYGFVPANYIEIGDAVGQESRQPSVADQAPTPSSAESPVQTPAAAVAGILSNQSKALPPRPSAAPPASVQRVADSPEASEEELESPPPTLPNRPPSGSVRVPSQPKAARSPESTSVVASPPYNRVTHRDGEDGEVPASGGFHMYNISEMISVMGKSKKLPTTLGINVATGKILIAPAKSRDGPQQDWTAEKLTHYSIESKHVFMELVRPSKSVDFHAGTKDTAQEIVAALGELAGAVRAEGLREVIAAGSGLGQRKGQMVYEFMAQGDDEVTVATGDEVIVLDDSKSEEWWMVRRLRNGKEGVVPSSYVEITGTMEDAPPSSSGINAGISKTEQNRLEEEKLARDAIKSKQRRRGSDSKGSEVGPGMRLPERGSSLHVSSRRDKRASKKDDESHPKAKPDMSRTRTWTDRSGSFKVDAAYLGCADGKIHLHKTNGVKIAVPVVKMAVEDLEYVERISGLSLDEDKPLSDIRRRSQNSKSAGLSIDPSTGKEAAKGPEYDWFDFFLQCGVPVYQCERYASNFTKDSMDESILPDITPQVLRTLGLKEGDILRVMKYLDNKYGRANDSRAKRNVSFNTDADGGTEDGSSSPGGGLFSGPSGTLRNNTRKGRPAPPVQTNDSVDAKAFEQKEREEANGGVSDGRPTPIAKAPAPIQKDPPGFDDDAWDVKPSKQDRPQATQAGSNKSQKPPSQQPQLTGALQELSVLSPPLQPTITHATGQQQPPQGQQMSLPPQQPPPQQQQPSPAQNISGQATGATPSFFNQLPSQETGAPGQSGFGAPAPNSQQTGYHSQNPQQGGYAPQNQYQYSLASRQRPQAPIQQQGQGGLLPPPPRPLSAPQNANQQGGFGPPPLQPQLTGYPAQQPQSSIAPPGQSLYEMRHQQTGQPGLQNQQTGFGHQNSNFGQFGGQNPMLPQGQSPPSFQNMPNGQSMSGPFSNPSQQQPQMMNNLQQIQPQPTMQQSQYQQPMQTSGINLPPPLPSQPTGFGQNFGQQGFGQSSPPPPPPIPQQPTAAPLQPQKTGPAPPVRFGVTGEAKKLAPQATGRRANLSQATPQNPFGF